MNRATLLAFSAIVTAGCASVGPISSPAYFPSNPNAVLLTHKGDLGATARVSTGGETVTAAYALSAHFGVLASGSAVLHKSGDPNGKQYSGEMGAGYFDTMTSSHVYSELYGGIGWGGGSSTFQIFSGGLIPEIQWQISGSEQTRFAIAWMQGASGYSRNNFSAVVLLRIADVDIYHDVSQGVVRGAGIGNYKSAPYDTTLFGHGMVWSLIPGFEVRCGFDHIQLIATVFFTQLTNPPLNTNPTLSESLGIYYKF